MPCVLCYLISSVSCDELISWEAGGPPVLFILKWGPFLLSQNLSRVAGVCTFLHICVSVCVTLSGASPAPGLENSSCYSRVPGWSPTLPGSPRLASSGCVHLNSCLVCLAPLLCPLAGVSVAQSGLCGDLLLTSQE